MADVGIFTKNADIQARAGVNANATSKAVAATDVYVLNVEGFINTRTNYNWSDAYSGLNVDVKGILTDAGACICAVYVINSDMSGYSSRQEALIMCNILWARAEECLKLLEKEANRDFVGNA